MRRIWGKRGAGEMKGRKKLRRAGIVLGFGALLSAGMLASGALGMVSIVTSTTDSTSTSTETTTTSETTTTTPSPFLPSITSDKADYNPGATVTLTGAGWGPGQSVHIFVDDNVGQMWTYSTDVTS